MSEPKSLQSTFHADINTFEQKKEHELHLTPRRSITEFKSRSTRYIFEHNLKEYTKSRLVVIPVENGYIPIQNISNLIDKSHSHNSNLIDNGAFFHDKIRRFFFSGVACTCALTPYVFN